MFAAHVTSAQDALELPVIGQVRSRPATEIQGSNWLVGCETLDRDFADYDAYKEYLVPLGIKRLRLQAGWNKTERIKGTYDWAWLDHIVNDATSRGLQPWLQFSYGNTNYPEGGGANLGAGVPRSEEALAGWDRWVEAMVTRYRDKVFDWEIWNEPNFSDNLENTPEKFAALTARTIKIVKRLQPEARISGLALGHMDFDYVERFCAALAATGLLEQLHDITYHDYVYNPDAHYHEVMHMKSIVHKYAPSLRLRQGENGAPSQPRGGGAIGDYDWTELSQAKWMTRRMLGDLGHDIETSVFTIIDIAYTAGPINRLNVKGLIQSDASKRALRPKTAYHAVQHVAALFDDSLERITNLKSTHNLDRPLESPDQVIYRKGTDRGLAVYGYRHKQTGAPVFTLWINESIPGNEVAPKRWRFDFKNVEFTQPVLVDIVSGRVHEIPASSWRNGANRTVTFDALPIYDSPVVLMERSAVPLK